ncbi:hypothetical protein [Delftia sp. WSY_14]|uniref:hypothetical protein n=1 Tax=unclassified Delftia TaxID=2613839 RepID=UPI00370A3861
MQAISATQEFVKAAKTFVGNSQEYCLFWTDWWPICMTKSEWASWVQATVVLLTIFLTFTSYAISRSRKRKVISSRLKSFDNSLSSAKGYLKTRQINDAIALNDREILILYRSCIKNISDSKELVTNLSLAFGDGYTNQIIEFFRAVKSAEGEVGGFLGLKDENGPSTELAKGVKPEQLNAYHQNILGKHLEIISHLLSEINIVPRLLFIL